jgi:predicted enzyme related to lactoylglutathione lyase
MSNTIIGLSIDAADAAALAAFWAEALGLQVAAGADQGRAVVAIGPDAVSVPRLLFHQVPEGKTVKNRLHLDLAATDWEAEIARLTDLGATEIRDVQEHGARWMTLADPEGNEFDLVRR